MKKTPKNKIVRASALSTVVLVGALAVGATAGASGTHRAHDATTTSTAPARGDGDHDQLPGCPNGGTVSAITSSSITVTSPNGTSTTYAINSSTTFSNNGVAASASSISTGDEVFIVVSPTSATTAASVNVVNLQPRGPKRAEGVIIAVSPTSITITNYAGVASTYSISSSTSVTKGSTAESVSDLAVNDFVDIFPSSTSSTAASSINIEPASLAGKVTAVSGNVITVSGWNNSTATIDVNSATTYQSGNSASSLSKVTVGTFVFAQGAFTSSNTLAATSVAIGQPGQHGPNGRPGPDNDFGPGGPAPAQH